MALERIGKILKVCTITVLALALGMMTGKYLSGYSRADATAVTPTADSDTAGVSSSLSAESGAESPVEEIIKPRPTILDGDFDRMTKEMRRAASRFPGSVGIYIKNLENGKEWALNSNKMMPSASLVKVPVMVGVFEKIQRGELRLDQPVVLTKQTRKGGSGHLKWRANGEQFTVRELLQEMMAYSDNIAQEMLIQTVGLKYLQERFPTYGFTYTNITKQGLSVAHRTSVENYTTAKEMGQLLENIYRGKKFGPEASAQMIQLMKGAKYNDRLTRQLPRGWVVAHKTGLLRRACHDIGVVYSPAGDYIICVLTSSAPNYRVSKRFISKVGAISYRYFERPAPSVASRSAVSVRPSLSPSY